MNTTATCIRATLVLAIVYLFGTNASHTQAKQPTLEELRQARKLAVRRPRGIIYNDDGGAIITGDSPEKFIEVRLKHIADTQVASVFNNTGQTTVFQHATQVAETIDGAISIYGANGHGRRQAKHTISLRKAGVDSLSLSLNFCRQNNIEYFWSLRMNDIHDALPGETWRHGRWKHEHPEFMLGKPEDWDRYPGHHPRKWWTAMDFAVPAVCDYLFRIIEEVCENYDVDGVELDWWRSPLFFRPTLDMKPVSQDQLEILNVFSRRVRRMTEHVGQQRGRPILVAARVPMSVQRSRAIGLDVVTWLQDDLVDLLTLGCGYAPLAMAPSVRKMVKFARPYNVPVFACISASGMRGEYNSVAAWRGAAMNIWHAGADGVYTFNFCPTEPDERFRQMGCPETLKGLDKIYAIDHISEPTFEGDLRPGLVVPDRLPVELVAGVSVTAKLLVGEDIVTSTPAGKRLDACLRLQVSHVEKTDVIDVKLNGTPLESSEASQTMIEFELDPEWVLEGENLVEIYMSDREEVVLEHLDLVVCYR